MQALILSLLNSPSLNVNQEVHKMKENAQMKAVSIV